jgi:N-acetylglutamate synthase-like GNAT family acetyltransferase
LIHLVAVPEAKSAYVKVLDLFLISTTTPGWFDAMGTTTV